MPMHSVHKMQNETSHTIKPRSKNLVDSNFEPQCKNNVTILEIGFKYCCFYIVLLCYDYMQTKCFIQITNYGNINIVDCLAKEGLKTMKAFVCKL